MTHRRNVPKRFITQGSYLKKWLLLCGIKLSYAIKKDMITDDKINLFNLRKGVGSWCCMVIKEHERQGKKDENGSNADDSLGETQ